NKSRQMIDIYTSLSDRSRSSKSWSNETTKLFLF
ncbi:unnamed protein product, partial [Rotaria sp. Silwood2]